MQKQRSRDTTPEMAIRRRLHAMGLRYRLHRQIVPGTRRTVDIVFGPARVAVDVRGCFWHGHGHSGSSSSNASYWAQHLARNIERDKDTESRLREAGWTVMIVWECEDPDAAAARVAQAVTSSSSSSRLPARSSTVISARSTSSEPPSS
jgi:DNA mismatch endonuclease, patch repair protein